MSALIGGAWGTTWKSAQLHRQRVLRRLNGVTTIMASKKVLGLTAATAALILGLTACGNGGDAAQPDGDGGEFQYGIIYPQTGALAFLGPPQLTGAEYAISEINEAGGILGTEVPAIAEGDEAGDAAQASEAANNLVGQGVNAVVGAAASGMTQAVYDTITGAEIVQCSGSNTAPDLSNIDDGGYYFRTAPSDLMSGPVMARQMVEDGHQSVAVIARADDYGSGYAQAVSDELEALGAEVVLTDQYDVDATNFDSVISSADNEGPDAIALISFDEGTQILGGLLETGFEGSQLYITDGLNDPELGESVDSSNPEVVTGITGVAPGADNPQFNSGLSEFSPELDTFQFAAQVFDCVTVIALAAESADSTVPADYVGHMATVTQDGTPCTGFAECRDLLADGEDIDYQGVSGNIAFADNGDPTTATFQIFRFEEDGYDTLGFETYDPED